MMRIHFWQSAHSRAKHRNATAVSASAADITSNSAAVTKADDKMLLSSLSSNEEKSNKSTLLLFHPPPSAKSIIRIWLYLSIGNYYSGGGGADYHLYLNIISNSITINSNSIII